MSPQTSAVKSPALKPTAAIATNVTIGTTLAMVTRVLTKAALCTPRNVSAWTTHSTSEAPRIATSVLPPSKAGKKVPRVAISSTR